ncbi:MAG: tetratricopeptide repeat protein [Armatimonadota bacterium]|nr:tetratricopeptide repeat protein [bacterium]
MRSLLLKKILSLITLVLLIVPASAAEKSRPVVVLFDTTKGANISDTLAKATTRAVRNYLRDSERVEATIFDRDSPAVQRAIVEKKFTADSIASYSTPDQRINVARTLLFDYAAGCEVSIKPGKSDPSAQVLELSIWLAKIDGDKSQSWQAGKTSVCAGSGDLDFDNAMQSAASAAVIDITGQAFQGLPRVKSAEPLEGDESLAINGTQPPVIQLPTATDYVTGADESLKSGNFALAIDQYSRAVSIDPGNSALRLKLADAYARKGLYKEAYDELDRAASSGAAKDAVNAARTKIEQLESGHTVPDGLSKPEVQPKSTSADKPSRVYLKEGNSPAAQALARIVQGDKLWGQGKPDDAALAYAEAIKLNPSDWRAHERLAIVDASMSLFGESCKMLQRLKQVQPNPSGEVIESRYNILRKAFDKSFSMLLEQYESDSLNFAAQKISRESYYNTINGIALRLESMAKFLDELVVPALKQPANLRRSLACGLAAQSASSMLDYLETNKSKSKLNADTFMTQAKSELQAASKLEENKVVITKEPEPEQPPQEEAP